MHAMHELKQEQARTSKNKKKQELLVMMDHDEQLPGSWKILIMAGLGGTMTHK
jgi:hypothetical protein